MSVLSDADLQSLRHLDTSRGRAAAQEWGARTAGLSPKAYAERLQAAIKIDISGAPPGTRVTQDPRNTADVDVTTGFQLWGFMR
jgi:hypothetical protein